MPDCKLCGKTANKTNTHYLTDSVIRTCLNQDGANTRYKGMMFDISNTTPFIDFKFQRNTPIESLTEALGREPDQDEIDKAKELDYSVDYVFCKACEDKFTNIEEAFTQKWLPVFRAHTYAELSEKEFDEVDVFRKFFLLQIWRTSVCDQDFTLPSDLMELLRIVFNSESSSEEQIRSIPLSVTYLNTIGDSNEYTKNFVGTGYWEDYRVIFFNDFFIQVFYNEDTVNYKDWYGLNDPKTFKNFINQGENIFKVKIVSNNDRLAFCKVYGDERSQKTINYFSDSFKYLYRELYLMSPRPQLTYEYVQGIINGPAAMGTRYTYKRIHSYTSRFFELLQFRIFH